MMGNKEVAGTGIASVAHQVAIKAATATTCQPAWLKPSGAGLRRMAVKRIGPTARPIR